MYGNFITLAIIPNIPLGLSSENITNNSFTLDWNAPSFDGGSEITDYVVEVNGGGMAWKAIAHQPSSSTYLTITGLQPATKYSVRVKAINSIGSSKVSATLAVTTKPQAPNAPSGLAIKSVTSTTVTITWLAPLSGGSKITDYLVEYSSDQGETWISINRAPSTIPNLVIKSLKTKTSYLFRVTAKNSVGYGAVSGSLTVVTP